jgi:hypothetical protein
MTRRSKRLTAIAALALGIAFGSKADATITFLPGNNPQPGEENILFGAKETGTTINGATNMSDIGIQFTSTETLLQNSSGQAQILNNAGGNLHDITVTAPGHTFTDFIVDLNKANGSTLDISVAANDGTFLDSFTGGNGSNFITILASGNETISSITFSSPDTGWEQFKQPRISGLAAVATPELSTWAMLLLGFAGLGFAGYRKAQGGRIVPSIA